MKAQLTGREHALRRLRGAGPVGLEVPEGSTTAIVGPNGAGKTTLLNCLCGMYRPSEGQILLRGRRLDRLRPHRGGGGGRRLGA